MTYIKRRNVETFTAAGAIAPNADTINLAGSSAIAMTLPDPDGYLDGFAMTIIASTAQAHTVTNTTGFNNGSTASDVATFGGAIGDNMVIVALGGVWYVVSTRNVTLA